MNIKPLFAGSSYIRQNNASLNPSVRFSGAIKDEFLQAKMFNIKDYLNKPICNEGPFSTNNKDKAFKRFELLKLMQELAEEATSQEKTKAIPLTELMFTEDKILECFATIDEKERISHILREFVKMNLIEHFNTIDNTVFYLTPLAEKFLK